MAVLRFLLIAALVCVSVAGLAEATCPSLQLKEYMSNPSGPETGKEYFKLVNTGTLEIDLSKLYITDNSGSVQPQGTLAPGQCYLLCQNADPAANGGIESCNLAYNTNIQLANSGSDYLVLFVNDGIFSDTECWRESVLAGRDGVAKLRGDDGSFADATSTFGTAGDFGSPDVCSLVSAEVSVDAAAVSAAHNTQLYRSDCGAPAPLKGDNAVNELGCATATGDFSALTFGNPLDFFDHCTSSDTGCSSGGDANSCCSAATDIAFTGADSRHTYAGMLTDNDVVDLTDCWFCWFIPCNVENGPSAVYRLKGNGNRISLSTCDSNAAVKVAILSDSCGSASCKLEADACSAEFQTAAGSDYLVILHAASFGGYDLVATDLDAAGRTTHTSEHVGASDEVVWFEIVSTGGAITASTCHEDTKIDTELLVFTSTCHEGSLAAGGNADNDYSCSGGGSGYKGSRVEWEAAAGRSFFLAVVRRGAAGASGEGAFHLEVGGAVQRQVSEKELVVRRGGGSFEVTLGLEEAMSEPVTASISVGGATFSVGGAPGGSGAVRTVTVTLGADHPIGPQTVRFTGTTATLDLFVLFNPYSPNDPVYLADPAAREEYLENEFGLVFRGSANSHSGALWRFGQYRPSARFAAARLLAPLSAAALADPVLVARHLSYAIGDQVLWGRWDGEYADGTEPTYWTGSHEILDEYQRTGEQVKYGQCWVFSGLTVSVARTLGIAVRSVTNFESAHESPDASGDYDQIIDRYFNKAVGDDGRTVYKSNGELTSDSIWNFHVWNDVWIVRHDLGETTGSWSAIDATPQEESIHSGRYEMGPASLGAVRARQTTAKYDSDFVVSEVDADVIVHLCDESGATCEAQPAQKADVGKLMATKAVGTFDKVDVMGEYKTAARRDRRRRAINTHAGRAAAGGLEFTLHHVGGTKFLLAAFGGEGAPRVDVQASFRVVTYTGAPRSAWAAVNGKYDDVSLGGADGSAAFEFSAPTALLGAMQAGDAVEFEATVATAGAGRGALLFIDSVLSDVDLDADLTCRLSQGHVAECVLRVGNPTPVAVTLPPELRGQATPHFEGGGEFAVSVPAGDAFLEPGGSVAIPLPPLRALQPARDGVTGAVSVRVSTPNHLQFATASVRIS